MDALKLKTEEIRKMDVVKLRETADEIRRELANIRMDIYSAPTVNTGKVRKLKKNLARVMTIQNENANNLMAKGKKK